MEVVLVPSEYFINLCFIRPELWSETGMAEELRGELWSVFPTASSLYVDQKKEEGLEIAVCELNGISSWESENDLLLDMEERLSDEWWSWLNGFRLQVIPVEDAGACALKKRS